MDTKTIPARRSPPPPKSWEELTFTDDFIFAKVMQDRNACTRLIETLLGIRVGHIEYIEEQKVFRPDSSAKSIRLDVYVVDSGRIFDIEIQTSVYPDLPERARYYQGLMDIGTLKPGQRYRMLKDSYVMFICTEDPFGSGRAVYTFENRCEEEPGLRLGDRSRKVFYNAEGYAGADREGVKEFLRYVKDGRPGDGFTQELDALVERAKHDQQWRMEYMTFEMKMQEERNAAYDAGREEGRCEGIAAGAEQTARNMLAEGFPVDQTARITGLSPERVRQLAAETGSC